MKHVGFDYEVKAEVTFTSQDLILLYYASRRHYDSTCHSLSDSATDAPESGIILTMILFYLQNPVGPCDYGGVGAPVRSHSALGDERAVLAFLAKHPTATATQVLPFRTLDLMAKTMEYYSTGVEVTQILADIGMLGPAVRAAEEAEMAAPLADALRSALMAINARGQMLVDEDKRVATEGGWGHPAKEASQ